MKTIAYVLADFPVLSETFIGDEIRAMRAKGHRVVPIIMRRRNGAAQPDDVILADQAEDLNGAGGVDVLMTLARPSLSCVRALGFVRAQARLPRRSLLWSALKIAAIARRNNCTHLHAHFAGGAAAHAIVAARWIGASVSFICHGHDVYAEPEDLKLKLLSADAAISTCNDMTADLKAIAPAATIATIYCGVEANHFLAADPRASNGRLLFVGRLVEQKGLGDLIAALAATNASHPVKLDIVGDGPLREELMSRAKSLGLGPDRLRFLGAQSRQWIADNAPRYAGLVAPFKQAPDGSRDTGPIVVKEAMAMQLPVIATRFMGLKEIVTSETGVHVQVGNVQELAQAMVAIVRMKGAQRLTMGVAARQRVETLFTLDGQAKTLSRLLEAA